MPSELNLEGFDATHENLRTLVKMLSVLGFKEGVLSKNGFLEIIIGTRKLILVFCEKTFEITVGDLGKSFENKENLQGTIIDSVKN